MLDGGCLLRQVPLLGVAARQAKLVMPALLAPVPEERPSRHRRIPSLAGERDERAAAVELCRRAMQVSRDAGTRTVVLDFGRLPIVGDGEEADLRRHFARREMDEGEPGGVLLAGLLRARRERAQEWVDGCRLALESLLRDAVPMDVQLAILPAATPWQVPSPRETTELLAEFAGAPVGAVFSPARLAVLTALGLGVAGERRATLKAAALLVEATDAVGLDQPLPLGMGELDPEECKGFPAEVPFVLGGPPDASPAEIRAAKKLLPG